MKRAVAEYLILEVARRNAAICFTVLLMLASGSVNKRANAAESAEQAGFAEVLTTAGIDSTSFRPFQDWDTESLLPTGELAGQLLFRLRQFNNPQRRSLASTADFRDWQDQSADFLGALVSIRGRVVGLRELKADGQAQTTSDAIRFVCTIEVEDSTNESDVGRVVVLTPQVPQSWLAASGDRVLNDPVALMGVLLGDCNVDGAKLPLLLTDNLAWFPDRDVSNDWALLAKLGYDVGLLDEVRHRRPFVKPEVSREGEAFSALLAAVRGTSATELDKQSKLAVAEREPSWQKRAAVLQRQGKKTQELGIALAAVERAKLGLSSVAPIFLLPGEEIGRLVRLEGTARRAVRIVPQGELGAKPYYELELYTSDSQNLPIVCCAASLPEGLPTGDAIRAPVRVAGFFFKSWRYRSRERSPAGESAEQSTKKADRPPVNLAPVLIIASPEWIQAAPSSDSSRWGMWGGIAALGLLAFVWLAMARLGRRDQLARRRNTRYDSPL